MQPFLFFLAISAIIIFLFRQKIKNIVAPEKEKFYTMDDQFNAERKERELEIDRLLSKMGENGIDDLTKKERNLLDELSKK